MEELLKDLYTPKEAAYELGITYSNLMVAAGRGKYEKVRLGSAVFFKRTEIDAARDMKNADH